MQTEYNILRIAHRIQYIKHCKENTLYYRLQKEYTILNIAHRIQYIMHCKEDTPY